MLYLTYSSFIALLECNTRDVPLQTFGKAVHEEFPSVINFELHCRISSLVHPHFLTKFQTVYTKTDLKGLEQFRNRQVQIKPSAFISPLEVFNKPLIIAENQACVLV